MPIAPVDYVADAMDAIAHRDGLDGETFCLVQTPAPSVGEMLRTFLRAAHGPDIVAKLDLRSVPALAQSRRAASLLPRSVEVRVSKALGMPVSVFGYAINRAEFDDSNTRAALEGSGITCPPLEAYAEQLWNYWEMHLHHDYKVSRAATAKLADKVVMVTGASSGIGNAVAKKLAMAGANVVLVARRRELLEETRQAIINSGGRAWAYPCDLSDMEQIDAMVDSVTGMTSGTSTCS